MAALSSPIVSEPVTATDPPRPASPPPAIPPPLVRAPIAPAHRRQIAVAGSAWAIARGGERGAPLGGQLGGSQAGVRVDLHAAARSAHRARRAASRRRCGARGREAASGSTGSRPRAPIHLIAEQRIALDGGRGGPTIELVGGFGPVAVAAGRLGRGLCARRAASLRDGIEGFADGAARVDASRRRGRAACALDIGVGAWGGAQRGAARVDIGPSRGAGRARGRAGGPRHARLAAADRGRCRARIGACAVDRQRFLIAASVAAGGRRHDAITVARGPLSSHRQSVGQRARHRRCSAAASGCCRGCSGSAAGS